MNADLESFIRGWREAYVKQQQAILLFNPELTAKFTIAQQQTFFVIFDELRRHFTGLLGYLAGLAPDQQYKRALLQNWKEENGVSDDGRELFSHDDLYRRAASSVGVDVLVESHAGRTRRSYTDAFNDGFVRFIVEQIVISGRKIGWNRIWSAVEAYELLDNVDYPAFLRLAHSFGLKGEALTFFEIHCLVEHFELGAESLDEIWAVDSDSVRIGFAFIKKLQLTAFRALSDELFVRGK